MRRQSRLLGILGGLVLLGLPAVAQDVKKQGRIATGGPDKISLINADGGDPRTISTGIAGTGSGVSRLSWSPDGRWIAFQAGDLYVLDVAGEKTTNLTTGTKLAGKLDSYGFTEPLQPSWSPDGKKLVVEADGLHVVDAEGRGVTRLDENVTWHSGWAPRSPQWSPDGKSILFLGYSKKNRYDLCVFDVEKGKTTNLTFEHATIEDSHRYHPSWSPDGSEIVFVGRGHGFFGLFVMAADGSKVRNLTERGHEKGSEGHPVWSPDGRRIAFQGRRDGQKPRYRLHVIDRDGKNEKALPAELGNSESPLSWSPDSSRLVYSFSASNKAGEDPRNGLYSIEVDGGKVVRLTKGLAGMPAWQPKVK